MDVEQLLNGGFEPLSTFMNYEELDSVLKNMRLPNGKIWPIPILFPKEFDQKISDFTSLALRFNGHNLALLDQHTSFQYDVKKLIKSFYGTDDPSHPGVQKTSNLSGVFITGKLKRLSKLADILKIDSLEPFQVRSIIKKKKWKTVVGFHTRNPPHRAHEYIHETVLKNHDGLLLHPVIGSKKRGDFTSESIMKSYKYYAENHLPLDRTILTPLLTYSRYAGPKEAIFTAIVRRNYGCTHFVVGRDHTGVKNFYGTYDSQKIFKNLDVGISIIPFSEPFYCSKSDCITTKDECEFGDKYYVEVSATRIRKAIKEKSVIPEFLIRPDILKILQDMDDVFVQ